MASILLDSCVWGGVLPSLRSFGRGVVWSGDWEADPGDMAILAAAHSGRSILVTLDKDFGELAIMRGLPHSGIIRLSGFRVASKADVIQHVVQAYGQELAAGAIITVDPERIRIRTA